MRGRDIVVPCNEAVKLLVGFIFEGVMSGSKERPNKPYSPRDVYQSIGAVEHSQCRLMTFHEPVLHIMLFPREKEAREAELFELQYGQAMRLCNVYYRSREYSLGNNFCHSVEEVCDNPVKHFYKERKLL